MKHVLTTIALILMGTTGTLAQTASPAAIEQESPELQEMRATAGGLKEVLQTLDEQRRTLIKLSGGEHINEDRAVELQNAIKTDMARTEKALNRMSGAKNEAWAAMKIEIIAEQESLSKSVAQRKQELEKTYGGK